MMREVKNGKAKSVCFGCESMLKSIEKDLLCYIFELREQGMIVQISTVILKANFLSRGLKSKSSIAQYHIVWHFVKSQGLVCLIVTRKCQKYPSETESQALDLLQLIRPKLTQPDRHQDFIVNIPVFFHMI